MVKTKLELKFILSIAKSSAEAVVNRMIPFFGAAQIVINAFISHINNTRIYESKIKKIMKDHKGQFRRTWDVNNQNNSNKQNEIKQFKNKKL